MKIRWKNTLINPLTDENWMLFICKYPALYFIPSTIMSGFGYYFYKQLTEFENGGRSSIFVGKLKIMYDLFGKWGIVGFFLFLAICFVYMFWIYAVSQTKIKIKLTIKTSKIMRTKQIITILFLAMITISCNKKASGNEISEIENAEKPDFLKYEWTDIDVSKTNAKYPIIVKGRKGCTTENSSENGLQIENEDMLTNYEVSGFMAGVDQSMIDNSKKVVKESDAYKFEKFIIDKPDSYIMKTSMGYMVGRFVKAGEITYECSMVPLYALENEADAQELYKMMGMLKLK